MIIQTCPKCGADLEHIVYTTYPPIHALRCKSCSWAHEQKERLLRVPFQEPQEDSKS